VEAYQELEQRFGEWAGVRNVVGCNSGTAALHLALEALKLPSGSEVVVPDFTMVACARAVTLAGLVPVFVDCGDDLLIRPDLIREAITPRAGAIMAVHVYGRRCDMAAIHRGNAHYVVEDLAEAHGVSPHPETDAACFSFYRNKIIAGEEGGAVAFREPEKATLARSLRSLGFTDAHDFTHIPRAHNYRLANSLASLILASLSNVEANIARRREIEGWYDAACPAEWRMPRRDAVWCYDLRIPGLTAERQTRIVRALQAAGIAARHGFKPMFSQEEYKGCRYVGAGNSVRLSREVLYLPLLPDVTREQAARAFAVVRENLVSTH
jgi:perosamine synthetase